MKRFLGTLALTLVVALPLAAQQPPNGGPQGGPGNAGPQQAPPDQLLKDVLGFSQAQLDSLNQGLTARHQAVMALQPQIAEADKAFRDALNAATPDASAIGTAALRLQTLQKQMRTLDDQFRTFFDGLLTADQKTKVASIKALQQSLQLGQVLNQLQVN